MERHRGEPFGQQPEHHRAPHTGGPFARYSGGHFAPHDRGFDHQKASFSGDGHLHNHNHNHNHHHNHNHNHPPSHNHQFNGELNDGFSSGGGGFRPIGGGGHGPDHFGSFSGRKRWFNHSGHDCNGGVAFVKLYVGCIPRTTTEEDIRSLFEEHGKILEVVLLKDKRTGQQQECCFVKYANMEEAERAIKALNNQLTLPGGVSTIKVKYADEKRERVTNCPTPFKGPGGPTGPGGPFEDKLYVRNLNKQATRNEIEEIFSPYGSIEDIYIVWDKNMNQSRGCGFVKLSNRDMSVAAINALNGNYVMRGCEQPLIVRFADPKKPRIGEPRGHVAFGSPKFGPRSQESLGWPASNVGDPMSREFLPYSTYPGSPKGLASSSCQVMHSNSSTSAQAIPAHSQPQAIPQTANQQPMVPFAGQQPPHAWQQSPSQESQQAQTQQKGSQSLKEAVSEMQKQLHPAASTTQNLENQQSSHVTTQKTGCNPQTVASASTETQAVLPSVISSSPVVCASSETADVLECDWSEHTCPDGFKYYYNCETCESRWEKPEEYILFLQQLKKHQKLQNASGQPSQSPGHSQALPAQQNFQSQVVQLQTELLNQKLESPTSSSLAGSLSCASIASNNSSHCPTVYPTGSCSSEGIRSCVPANV